MVHIIGAGKQIGDGLAVDALDAILQRLGPAGMLGGHTGVVFQAQHGQMDLFRRVLEQRHHAAQVIVGLHVQDLHLLHRGEGIVHDIIDGPGEGKDILPVNRRDKGPVQIVDQDAAHFVGILFGLAHRARMLVGSLLHVRFQGIHAVQRDLGLQNQRLEKLVLPRLKELSKSHYDNFLSYANECTPTETDRPAGTSRLPAGPIQGWSIARRRQCRGPRSTAPWIRGRPSQPPQSRS